MRAFGSIPLTKDNMLMHSRRAVSLYFVMALSFAPLAASAQGSSSNNLQTRVQALEAAVAALQNSLAAESTARANGDSTLAANLATEATSRGSADTALSNRTGRLEGNIAAADLAGTYQARGIISDLDGGSSPSVTHGALNAVVTLNANGTGTLVQSGAAIELVGPTTWTDNHFTFPAETITISWSYLNGFINITDGTAKLDLDFAVGAGGRVLIYSGLSDDNTIDIVVATRLQ